MVFQDYLDSDTTFLILDYLDYNTLIVLLQNNQNYVTKWKDKLLVGSLPLVPIHFHKKRFRMQSARYRTISDPDGRQYWSSKECLKPIQFQNPMIIWSGPCTVLKILTKKYIHINRLRIIVQFQDKRLNTLVSRVYHSCFDNVAKETPETVSIALTNHCFDICWKNDDERIPIEEWVERDRVEYFVKTKHVVLLRGMFVPDMQIHLANCSRERLCVRCPSFPF
jgi:hypothetical protein